MAALPQFHSRTGTLVTLSNDNRTAKRNHPTQEFNNGVILGADPLKDGQIFEVRIDKKVNSWSGSIEIGVTTCNPNNLNFPISATGFREGTWVMSGSSILKDGHSMIEEYGCDLDQLSENDQVGVMRTSQGVLHFFVNGIDQGCAATGIPPRVYPVIDMYGKCSQISIVDSTRRESNSATSVPVVSTNLMTNELANELANEFLAELSNQIANDLAASRELACNSNSDDDGNSNDRLRFHETCGTLVRLSNNRRTAERRRPMDEFNNGVVMTNRPLRDDELFEIRLDRLVDKWSGSIEVGITTHNPSNLEFPATMTNMRSGHQSGTIMMSGCGILTNGKGTRREYGHFNLDELTEGDRIGLIRKAGGCLHYYINGLDQGVASTTTPTQVWGVVDLYGMAVKVTIIDRQDPSYPNELSAPFPETRAITADVALRHFQGVSEDELAFEDESEKLMFNPQCGAHASVINGQRTAHRPNALDDFNNGVVLTSRTLRPSEVFEVRLDKMVDKWAGSIEIGLTTHSPGDLDFPSTMTNIRSGTWMMTGNGVMHNGTTVIDDYGQNLDRLKVGDRVGVVRKPDGTVHFSVNGIDQGVAASNVPDNVYGVIDLYGQAAQATIVSQSDFLSSPEMESSVFTETDDLRFHQLHGNNATILNNGKTAVRPNANGDFNDAIIVSSRPLRDHELFEVVIERMVERWSGSIEAGQMGSSVNCPQKRPSRKSPGFRVGVTLIKPEDLEFTHTMTDINYSTWMLSGSAIMKDGCAISTIRIAYPLDLDTVTVGTRIGMMRCSDGTLHYFLNGEDQGVACTDIPPDVYAVIDLYGQCAQVTITGGSSLLPSDNHLLTGETEFSLSSPGNSEVTHRFSNCCGKNIVIKNNGSSASRIRNFNHGVVFSSEPLKHDELFEVKVEQISKQWSGSMHIGLTTMAISDCTPVSQVPSLAEELTSKITWIVSGSEVKKCGVTIKENYAPSLERLEIGNRVGLRRCSDGTMHIYLNGEDLGIAASNIPKNVFAVIDLYGAVETVSIISSAACDSPGTPRSLPTDDSSGHQVDQDRDMCLPTINLPSFHGNHGKNICLSGGNITASRQSSYNQGIVVTSKALPRKKIFQVRIDKLNPKWSSSIIVGVLGFVPDRYNFPGTAISIKKSAVVIQGDSVFTSGNKIKERYGPNLDNLQVGHFVGVVVDDDNCLHLYVNGVDQGVAARDIPNSCYALVDVYGQCEQVTIVGDDVNNLPPLNSGDDREKADIDDVVKEKIGTKLCNESNILRNCEYQNLCSRLRTSLGLPDGYFDGQCNMCFCETCHKIRGDNLYHCRGDPPRDYAIPYGWCRFVLTPQNKAHSLNVYEKWHAAYHGACMESVRRILDNGDLLLPGDSTSSSSILIPQPQVFTEKSKPDSFGGCQISFSPTVRYAGSPEFSPKQRFVDPKTKKIYQARVAFQLWVKPGSYKVGPETIATSDRIDPHFNNNELEWATKERGSTMLYALLLKVE
ncbi:neuralized-like protein 4 [Gigantopelta aegis]|uniref:neuralized-like protein 4 n=1 Tax=Gigantopelta aegis TaxID=1735272 RepID=UPI001B88E372|nr:neuralized-like protein 4 [Gigantopelta aegis]